MLFVFDEVISFLRNPGLTNFLSNIAFSQNFFSLSLSHIRPTVSALWIYLYIFCCGNVRSFSSQRKILLSPYVLCLLACVLSASSLEMHTRTHSRVNKWRDGQRKKEAGFLIHQNKYNTSKGDRGGGDIRIVSHLEKGKTEAFRSDNCALDYVVRLLTI